MLYLQHTITLGILSLLTWGCGNSDKQKGEAEQAPLADKVCIQILSSIPIIRIRQ